MVVPLDFLRIPLIAMVGWMFYGEALDGFVFAGRGADHLWRALEPVRGSAAARAPVAATTEKVQSGES